MMFYSLSWGEDQFLIPLGKNNKYSLKKRESVIQLVTV